MDFKDWYKQEVEAHTEEPPAFVWDEIQNRLDVQNAWCSIESELDKRDALRIQHISRWAAAAVILLLLGISFSTPNQEGRLAWQTTPAAITPQTHGALSASAQQDKVTVYPHEIKLSQQIAAVLPTEKDQPRNIPANGKEESSKLVNLLDPVEAHRVFAHTQPRGLMFLTPMDEFEFEDEYNSRPVSKRITFGVIGSVNNTWLFQRYGVAQRTIEDTQMQSVAGVGKNIGFVVDFEQSERASFQMELLHTESSQRFENTFTGKYLPEELNIKYLTLNLLGVQRHNHFLGDIPASHNIIYGFGIGLLTSARLYNGDSYIDVKNRIARENVSLNFGYEYEAYPLKRWGVSIGLRANYGLSNLEREPIEDERLNSFSWGGHIAIKYLLRK